MLAFFIIYFTGVVVMFANLELGLLVIGTAIWIHSIISTKNTDKFQKQLLEKIDTITKTLKNTPKTNSNSKDSSKTSKKSLRKVKNTQIKSYNRNNKKTEESHQSNDKKNN